MLDNINPLDRGSYKCRVDFKTAPTRCCNCDALHCDAVGRISSILLDVIVPPEKPRIHDESSKEVRLKLGPYQAQLALST